MTLKFLNTSSKIWELESPSGGSPEPCALDIKSNPSQSDSDSHGLSRVLSVMYNSRYRPRPSVLLATALI